MQEVLDSFAAQITCLNYWQHFQDVAFLLLKEWRELEKNPMASKGFPLHSPQTEAHWWFIMIMMPNLSCEYAITSFLTFKWQKFCLPTDCYFVGADRISNASVALSEHDVAYLLFSWGAGHATWCRLTTYFHTILLCVHWLLQQNTSDLFLLPYACTGKTRNQHGYAQGMGLLVTELKMDFLVGFVWVRRGRSVQHVTAMSYIQRYNKQINVVFVFFPIRSAFPFWHNNIYYFGSGSYASLS
jgi:hypothetical protein